jgi:carboxylate-amine ligase
VCLDVEDAVAIAALVRALAWSCARDARAGTPTTSRSIEVMNAAIWRAARYGTDGELVDAMASGTHPAAVAIDELLAFAGEGLELHGDAQLVHDQVEAILRRGNGATTQRHARASADGDIKAVVDALIEQTAP